MVPQDSATGSCGLPGRRRGRRSNAFFPKGKMESVEQGVSNEHRGKLLSCSARQAGGRRGARGGSVGGEKAKSALSSPGLGRERTLALRGATQFQAPGAPLWPFCCGKGTAPVSGPAGSAVFAGSAPWGPLNRWGPSLSGGCPGTHAPSWRWGKAYRVKGMGLGFITSRQSRSPRFSPWMSSSAVATLVAMGTEY